MFSNIAFTRNISKIGMYFSPVCFSKIAVNWHVSNNFGDLLAVYIAQKLSGKKVLSVSETSNCLKFQVIGSILSLANDRTLVWGTGFASRMDAFSCLPRKIYMLRGKYSLEICRKLGFKGNPVFGDPGYIISRLYQPRNLEKKYVLGVIPHWIHYEFCKALFKNREDVLVINLLNPNIEVVIDQILQCRQCISSSLHGLIVSHSYNIPAMHVTFSDHVLNTNLIQHQLCGDGMKFLDYFSSVGISEYAPIEISVAEQADEILRDIPQNCGNRDQINKILLSCPFAKTSWRQHEHH